MTGETYLRVEGLTKRFGAFTALAGINLAIQPREFVCFLGPSGCGKTTLLRAIAGLDPQSEGRIWQGGREISSLPPSERDFGIVFQSYALFPNLNVAANVGYGLVSRGRARGEIAARVAELLELVGLPESAAKYPAQLSGGQQQRVALARALATSPGLLLLDEPLSALDARVRVRLRHEIRELQRRLGITTIMVTHDQEEALTMADRIVVMNQGVIEQIGTPLEIYRSPASPFVADFVGTMNFLHGAVAAPGRVQVDGLGLACETGALAAGAGVRVCVRPEDVRTGDLAPDAANAFEAAIDLLEFLGSFWRAGLRPANGGGVALTGDFPPHLVRERDLVAGKSLRVALPPERLLVFPRLMASVLALPRTTVRASRDDLIQRAGILLLVLWLGATVAAPLGLLLAKSFQDRQGEFAGLANYVRYFSTPALFASLWNSVGVALVSTAIVVPLAFVYAYALTRSCMPGRALFQAVALIPILAPSLLPAISLIYLFGNQGFFKSWMFGNSIYGPVGIIIAQVFYCFPHALMILVTALAMADARLYEAADALGASSPRIFWTVTLPGARYGVISAAFVIFTLVITDFGIAKVIGGGFNVLATDVYKQVIGQQNFEMGAVVGMILLAPALLSFVADRMVQRRQMAALTVRAVPLVPMPAPRRDMALFAFCLVIAGIMVGVLGIAAWGSLITYWPYNLSLSLKNYEFDKLDASGWGSYWNSLRFAGFTAVVGTVVVFLGAYLVEKSRGFHAARGLAQLLAMLPLAVPGLVLGLSYIFFFNARWNPFNVIYATMAILVVNTIAHFYTVSHLTAVTALKQLDAEFESVSQSLKVPFWRTLFRVTIPVCLPAILDVAVYMFMNAMTTVSSVIFLYGTNTKLAAIAIINMDEAGATAAAAAMAMTIVATSAAVKVAHVALARVLDRTTHAWRRR